ncbi:hypothetical protein PYW07_012565 [Mythimna separata]|uniref:DHHA2 domain-containing protein n=1 Tax=Mythimna separata TaxID=271217 RepID=A0AAD7Y8S5_MYTSE|nr:hypothetical protein PYW07_012565 [Mythimna separata]
MDEFFSTTLTNLHSNNYNDLTLVIGNESCDLDSAVSALVFANFLTWQYNQIRCKVCTKAHRGEVDLPMKEDIFVPVLNVDRCDYELKTEVVYYFRSKGIKDSDLVFRDDYDLEALVNNSKSKVVLVDHHVLAKRDRFLAPFVTEIIDHRPMDKSEWLYKKDVRSTIETVGSCCTLIAQRIKDLSVLVAKDVDFFNAYPVCTEMLRATIILDTVNFSTDLNKATPHDKDIVQFLESLMKPRDLEADRQREHDSLIAARKNVANLTPAQLLKKDVKIVGDVYIPSFPILVKEFLNRPGALDAVSEALQKNNCSVALLLGMDLTEGLQRDTALYSPKTPEKAVKLSKYLEEATNPSLGLSREQLSGAKDCSYYWQLNLSASRKQYIPTVNTFTANK